MRSQKWTLVFACIVLITAVTSCSEDEAAKIDATSSATLSLYQVSQPDGNLANAEGKKALIILYSGSEGGARKLANVIAGEIDAFIFEPGESNDCPEDLEDYELIGFGSGIFSARHHPLLLEFAKKLPEVENKRAFIFSTNGAPAFRFSEGDTHAEEYMDNNHKALRDVLLDKGFTISGEFSCPGLNKNSFLKLFGGINKGRPNDEDLKNAADFVRSLLEGDLNND